MGCATQGSVICISVDLEFELRHRIRQQIGLEAATNALVDLFCRYDVPATWCVADPVLSAATDCVLSGGDDHEMAILGDASWAGPLAGRSLFSRELSRRVLSARAAGLPVSSLVMRDAKLPDHIDLFIKNEITAVRGIGVESDISRSQPQQPRFGLWEIPAHCLLPGDSRWLRGGGGVYRAKSTIDRCIAQRQSGHLVVDGPRLVEVGASGIRVVERMLRHLTQRRDEGRIFVKTLFGYTLHAARGRHTPSTRSILKAA